MAVPLQSFFMLYQFRLLKNNYKLHSSHKTKKMIIDESGNDDYRERLFKIHFKNKSSPRNLKHVTENLIYYLQAQY